MADEKNERPQQFIGISDMLRRASFMPLPFYQAAEPRKEVIKELIPGAGLYPQPPYEAHNPVMESCALKAGIGTAGGWAMGILLGLFMGALGGEMSSQVYQLHKSGKEAPQAPILEQMRVSYRAVGHRALGMGASFATITCVFSGIECIVEKYRGKHDLVNGAVSGCAAGAALSAKSGPATACMGCVGFAAFSVAIEAVMGPH